MAPSTVAPAVLDHPKLGRLLFFDPTDPYVAPGYLPEHEQASLALAQRQSGRPSQRLHCAHGILLIHMRRIPRPSADASENENAPVSENALTG